MTPGDFAEPPHVVRLLTIRAEGWLRPRHRFVLAPTPEEPLGRIVMVARVSRIRGTTRIVTRAGSLPESPARACAIARFASPEPTAAAVLRDARKGTVVSAAATLPGGPVELRSAAESWWLKPIDSWWRGAKLYRGDAPRPWAQIRPATLTGRESSLAFFDEPAPLLGAFAYLLACRRWGLGEPRLGSLHARLLARARPRRV